jgi:hypothetical protein
MDQFKFDKQPPKRQRDYLPDVDPTGKKPKKDPARKPNASQQRPLPPNGKQEAADADKSRQQPPASGWRPPTIRDNSGVPHNSKPPVNRTPKMPPVPPRATPRPPAPSESGILRSVPKPVRGAPPSGQPPQPPANPPAQHSVPKPMNPRARRPLPPRPPQPTPKAPAPPANPPAAPKGPAGGEDTPGAVKGLNVIRDDMLPHAPGEKPVPKPDVTPVPGHRVVPRTPIPKRTPLPQKPPASAGSGSAAGAGRPSDPPQGKAPGKPVQRVPRPVRPARPSPTPSYDPRLNRQHDRWIPDTPMPMLFRFISKDPILQLNATYEGNVVDLSESGMSFKGPVEQKLPRRRLEKGYVFFELQLQLPGVSGMHRVFAGTMRFEPDQAHSQALYAVKFRDIPRELQEAIRRIIVSERFSRSRGKL